MNILQCGLDLYPAGGGTYRSVLNFARAFVEAGLATTVLSFDRPLSVRTRGSTGTALSLCSTALRSIETTGLPILRSYHWVSNPRVRFLLNDAVRQADIVVFHGPYAHPFAIAAKHARKWRKPYVVIAHGGLDFHNFTYRRFRKELWLRLTGEQFLADAANVVFSSQSEAERAVAQSAIRKATIILWPSPVRVRRNKPLSARDIRARHGLREDCRLALFVGRLHPVKRIFELTTTFSESAGQRNWALLLVGPCSSELSERSIARLSANGTGVVYVGERYGEELSRYYEAAEVLFCVSHKENFAYCVAEACAAGTAVAVSSGVGLSGPVDENGCGFVLQDGDDLRDFVRKVTATPPEVLQHLGNRARDWAARELSWNRFSASVTDLLASVVGEHVAAAGRGVQST